MWIASSALDTTCAAGVPRPLAWQPLQPQLAASAPNDPHGFGDTSPRTPLPRPEPAPPAPQPGPDAKESPR